VSQEPKWTEVNQFLKKKKKTTCRRRILASARRAPAQAFHRVTASFGHPPAVAGGHVLHRGPPWAAWEQTASQQSSPKFSLGHWNGWLLATPTAKIVLLKSLDVNSMLRPFLER